MNQKTKHQGSRGTLEACQISHSALDKSNKILPRPGGIWSFSNRQIMQIAKGHCLATWVRIHQHGTCKSAFTVTYTLCIWWCWRLIRGSLKAWWIYVSVETSKLAFAFCQFFTSNLWRNYFARFTKPMENQIHLRLKKQNSQNHCLCSFVSCQEVVFRQLFWAIDISEHPRGTSRPEGQSQIREHLRFHFASGDEMFCLTPKTWDFSLTRVPFLPSQRTPELLFQNWGW